MYQLHTPAFAILNIEQDRVPITIPANAYIYVIEMAEPASEKTLVEVEWNGKTLMMFAYDFKTRATIVHAVAPTTAKLL